MDAARTGCKSIMTWPDADVTLSLPGISCHQDRDRYQGVHSQATVQAALASLPLEAVNKAYPVGSPNYAQYHQWATDALTVAVFEVIISGTLGCLLVRWLSPLLLTQVRAAWRRIGSSSCADRPWEKCGLLHLGLVLSVSSTHERCALAVQESTARPLGKKAPSEHRL